MSEEIQDFLEIPFEEGTLYLGALCAENNIKPIHMALPEGCVLQITLGPFEGGVRLSDRVFAPLFMTDKGLKCEVEEARVTQFHLGETLKLRGSSFSPEAKKPFGYEVTFLLKEGSARFVGRIAVGNRDDPKGKIKEVTRGLDRMIFLEALEPFEKAVLQLEIKAIKA